MSLCLRLAIVMVSSMGFMYALELDDLNCPTSLCKCEETYTNQRTFKISCPKRDPTVHIKVFVYYSFTYGYQLDMEANCSPQDGNVYELLSKMNLSLINYMTYENCPLPKSNISLGNGMTNLEEIYFSHSTSNSSIEFKGGHFSGLSAVKRLFIASNNINDLPENIFAETTELEKVVLKINHVPLIVFHRLSKLKNITIGSNVKWDATTFYTNNLQLETVSLSASHLPILTKLSLDGISHIRNLVLISNDIESLETDALSQIKGLRTIKLENNRMPSLKNGIFQQNEYLRSVAIVNQTIETPQNGFLKGLAFLETVEFTHCYLTLLPVDIFANSTNISEVIIRNNSLTTVPSGIFDDLVNLQKINLNDNELTSLPVDLFGKTTKLTDLTLEHNKFKTISDAVPTIPLSVTSVDLSHNQIKDITADELKLVQNYVSINLYYNVISGVSAVEHVQPNRYEYRGNYQLGHNPFDCRCGYGNKFFEFINNQRSYAKPFSIWQMKCAKPEHLSKQLYIRTTDVACN